MFISTARPSPAPQGALSNHKNPWLEPPDHAIGRSRGGLTTKVHLVADGRGRPLGMGPDYSGSLGLVKAMLDGQLPFLPDTRFGVADVRDVAALHILVMTDPRAVGERFIASGGYSSFADIAGILRDGLGAQAAKVPTRRIPTWLLKTLAVVVKPLRELSADTGVRREPQLGKATQVLGWQTRPTKDTILDTARSLLALEAGHES